MNTNPVRKFSLGATERLKSTKKIQELFASGRIAHLPPFKIIYKTNKETLLLQFGVAVGTRQFKKAVDRNKIKRRIREAYRLQKNELKGWVISKQQGLSIFIIYTGKEIPEYDFVFERIGKILKKIKAELDASA